MRRFGIVAATVLLSLLAATHAHATSWTGTTGDWHYPLNWDNGIPTSSDVVYIDNGGTAQISANAESANLYAGYHNSGAIELTDGIHTVSDMYLGHEPGSSGTYKLSGTGELSVGWETIGLESTGEFKQTGGIHRVNIYLFIGCHSGCRGTYNLSAGELSVGNSEYIGSDLTLGSGVGVFNQDGGDHTVDNYLYLGRYSGSSGTYNLLGGSLKTGYLEIYNGWMDIDVSEIDLFAVSGDKVNLLDGYIAGGKIIDSTLGAGQYLYAVYDSENDWTTLVVLPEPSTLLLLTPALLGFAGIVLKRRK